MIPEEEGHQSEKNLRETADYMNGSVPFEIPRREFLM